ncbi:uncharacterized protein TRUGW13939_00568 [Talaromyces rugulosus]|uniref:Uncharacterized protein n=1 Tax=Talaromyces rugulosus TaxID=121627 RepID=A0A7H8QHN2_TALRU|nr:uncharacterized protein TRUGW13939_00568 [Talaromyces rugulosus]QKX53489.1 hypothetical protein TRUGW13939_00568 [Talaromyces rugulosus]
MVDALLAIPRLVRLLGPVAMVNRVTSNVFSFMCKDNQYGCHATATAGVVWTGVMTNIGLPTPTEEPATRTPSTAEGIEAWGIKLLSVAPETSTTTSLPLTTRPATTTQAPTSSFPSSSIVTSSGLPTSSGTPEQSSSKSGLGTGAEVGIAIGSALGAALVALGAFLFYRNRKKNKQVALPPAYTAAPLPKHEHELDGHDAPQLLDSQHPQRVWELGA